MINTNDCCTLLFHNVWIGVLFISISWTKGGGGRERKREKKEKTRFRWCTLKLISRNRSIINSEVMGTHVYIQDKHHPPTLFQSAVLLKYTKCSTYVYVSLSVCVFFELTIVFSYLFSNHNVLKDSSILPYNVEKITIFNSVNFACLYACVIPILN